MQIPSNKYGTFDRNRLAKLAVSASIKARTVAKVDLVKPINVYDACHEHGVIVRFNNISMEGMYDRQEQARIHISALRPMVRRNLTCAHELGHHVFGHGSTIDELNNRIDIADHNNPDEFIANQFAYFFMMPTLGIRNAFSTRGISIAEASAQEVYRVACNYGVGYITLLTHMRYGLKYLPDSNFQRLCKIGPKAIRMKILSMETNDPLVVVDRNWTSPTLDLETGDYVTFPSIPNVLPNNLVIEGQVPGGCVCRAIKAGIGRTEVAELDNGLFVRVAKRSVVGGKTVGYVGLARYRHMEDDEDE